MPKKTLLWQGFFVYNNVLNKNHLISSQPNVLGDFYMIKHNIFARLTIAFIILLFLISLLWVFHLYLLCESPSFFI